MIYQTSNSFQIADGMFFFQTQSEQKMPLTIAINLGAKPVPQIVPPAVVVQQARKAGNPNAAQVLAFTYPIIRSDQTGLHYFTRPRLHPTDFRFRTGVLRLTLRQTIHIANDLSACAQGIWAQHEQDHVRDNQGVMRQIDREIRIHHALQTIFFSPQWYPIGSFNKIQSRIKVTVSDIFKKLTLDAVKMRDTPAVYAQFQRRILRTCPEPFYHAVLRGETLSKLALFYYGNYRSWRSIYRENKRVIGRDPDLIYPGQQLLIPKSP